MDTGLQGSRLRPVRATLLILLLIFLRAPGISLAETQHVVVPADVSFTDTGITLEAGREVFVTAYGLTHNNTNSGNVDDPSEWSGPDGRATEDCADGPFPLPNYPRSALIGKVGSSGSVFGVGSHHTFVPATSGRLFLGINDISLGDNFGRLIVFVFRSEAVLATPTTTPSPSPTLLTPIPCDGDCNSDGSVSVNELITCVNIALGNTPVGSCPACDCNATGQVTIACLISAVGAALSGC